MHFKVHCLNSDSTHNAIYYFILLKRLVLLLLYNNIVYQRKWVVEMTRLKVNIVKAKGT